MEPVRFGRWLSERRRKYGWASQRAFVEALRQSQVVDAGIISEDGLSRLEAGRLSHPFRGHVRQLVLAMAWLLCNTPQDVQQYLEAAELTELSIDETRQLTRLYAHFSTPHRASIVMLPPRPRFFVGRHPMLQDILHALNTEGEGLYALTGSAGIGKSALAYALLYQLVTETYQHLFPDGIIVFSATGRHGSAGLLALLNEIISVFGDRQAPVSLTACPSAIEQRSGDSWQSFQNELTPLNCSNFVGMHTTHMWPETELASAIDRSRLALADKRLLIVLDDIEEDFPLRAAMSTLLTHVQYGLSAKGAVLQPPQRVILTTSRHTPPLSLITRRIRVGPLSEQASCDLFASLLGYPIDRFTEEEQTRIRQICQAVNYHPLAIEDAAQTVGARGMALSRLAELMQGELVDSGSLQ